ncbi:hypothetical protein [Kribbella sp. DT2]|uniref:hypothetical protein n=1 Tax=Kribbella sp. DT2 TaxID=3393427 RepID=UPI003CF88456
MPDGDRLVPRDSAVHREFTRPYQVSRSLRETPVDRWNGDLYATYQAPDEDPRWGRFDPKTGALHMSADLVLRHLTGSVAETGRQRQSQALATVLHESTHTGMLTDAPGEPNAVRDDRSLGVMEGVAEYRAVFDFDNYVGVAGYHGLVLAQPQYPGPFAAMDDLVAQVSGPSKDRQTLFKELTSGPGAMRFDQLADSVVRNRLADVVPSRPQDQQAVKAALITRLANPLWPTLLKRPAGSGLALVGEIRQHLNSEVDKTRHHYGRTPQTPYPSDAPNPAAVELSTGGDRPAQPERASPGPVVEMRFLDAQPPASRATSTRPSLGQGVRGAGAPATSRTQRPTERRWDQATDKSWLWITPAPLKSIPLPSFRRPPPTEHQCHSTSQSSTRRTRKRAFR